MAKEKLTFGKQLCYAAGMMGWSMLTNTIIVMLPYYYLPPDNAGLTQLVPQLLLLGVLNIFSLILASGRLVDALYDPFIASLSDRSKSSRGRRIPFMRLAIVPSALFCFLTFHPLQRAPTLHNAWWLGITMILFFISVTTYMIPYNALLPEMTDTDAEKVRLSSFQQVGFVLGIIVAALTNNFADLVQRSFQITDRDTALQLTIAALCVLSAIFLLIPVLTIDERRYSTSKPSHLPILPAIRQTFANPNFRYYLISDFSYYMALSIISSGLLFFVTVLLGLPESEGGAMMGAMVLASLVFYPLINYLAARWGKKPVVLVCFGLLSLIFIGVYFLGTLPVSPHLQIYTLLIGAAFPLAGLGILPNAILAEIAQRDAMETGENREGMFFAVKYLFVKLGQTLGIALFAFLTIYGKDPGHDRGLRLNGVCGMVLCVFAFLFFSRFRENRETIAPKAPAR
jgi:GPH family glycoside/pentoside/hexuronide:cation symporter